MSEHCQLTPRLVLTILAATIGGSLPLGYHLACLNAPADPIKQWINKLASENDSGQNRTFHTQQMSSDSSRSQLISAINGSADLSPRCQVKQIAMAEDRNVFAFSIVVTIFIVGGMIGGLMGGTVADKIGRTKALLYNNVLGFCGIVAMFIPKYLDIGMGAYYLFTFGRFTIGLNSGVNYCLVPLYLMQIAPIDLRGSIASVSQLFLTIGVLFATFVGIFLSTETLWPFIIAFGFVPIVVGVILLPHCPESPKYDLIIGHDAMAAERCLRMLRPINTNEIVIQLQAELEALKREADAIRSEPELTYSSLFTSKELRWPLMVSVVMMAGQQLSGINAVIYYSTEIFELDAGFTGLASRWASCIIFVLYVFFTVISTWLVDHPRFGRRLLVLVGFVGNIVFLLLLFATLTILNCISMPNLVGPPWNYLAILFVVLYVASFAAGPGSIPWFYFTEVFHSSARGKAGSIVSIVNWTCNFSVGICFPALQKAIGPSTFVIFASILSIVVVFVFIYAPETKGKTVDEINAEMMDGRVICKAAKPHLLSEE